MIIFITKPDHIGLSQEIGLNLGKSDLAITNSKDYSVYVAMALAVAVHAVVLGVHFDLVERVSKAVDRPVLSLTLSRPEKEQLIPASSQDDLSEVVFDALVVPKQARQENSKPTEPSTEALEGSPKVSVLSHADLEVFTKATERQRSERLNKVDISKPREGSYAEVYQEKRTTERKHDPIADQLVDSPNGVIRKSRVNGREYCSISIARGASFNGLMPYQTGVSGFRCESPDDSNAFLDKHGKIANSDREEW